MCDLYNVKSDIPEKLDIKENEEKEMKKFKERVIYKEILAAEKERQVFSEWADFNVNAKWEKKGTDSEIEEGMIED